MKKHILLFIILIVLFPSIVLAEGKEDLKVSTYIENLNDSSLKRDNTSDNNLRYTGSDPNNYVYLGSYNKEYYVPMIKGDMLAFLNRLNSSYESPDYSEDECVQTLNYYTEQYAHNYPNISGECRKKDNSDYYYIYFELPFNSFVNSASQDMYSSMETCNSLKNYLWLDNYITCEKKSGYVHELWRIVGVFNNVDNGDGTSSKKVKLVRYESINSFYPGFTTGDATPYMNNLENYLNNTYINGKTYMYTDIDLPNYIKDQGVVTFNEYLLDYVDKAKWTIYSLPSTWDKTISLNDLYELDKNSSYSYTNYIGLVSETDILYSGYDGDQYSTQYDNYSINSYIVYPSQKNETFYLTSGLISYDDYNRTNLCSKNRCFADGLNGSNVKPEIYLKEDIYVVDGDGSLDSPYILASDIINESVSISEQEDYLLEQLEEHPEISYQIEDPEIVKIVDGKIIPLKVGKTTITYQIGATVYVYEIEVTEADLVPDNPATGREFNYCLVVLFVFVAYLFIRIRNKKYI